MTNDTTNGTGPGDAAPAGPPPHPPEPLPTWFMITTMSTLSLFAVVGNILAIFCFLRFRKKLKQNTVAYLISLAASDLWIGFMTGCGVLSVVYKRWVLGDFLCQAIAFLNNVALINSLWTVALGSVDRCFAIRVPFKHRSIITKKRLAVLILGTWTYACLLSLPPLLGVETLAYTYHSSHPWCAMSSRLNVVYFIVFYIGFLPIPILIIIASYVVIFITTRRYTRRQIERLSGSSPSWRPLSGDYTHVEVADKTTNSPPRRPQLHSSLTYPGTNERLSISCEVPLNISSSYDTLKVRKCNCTPQHSPTRQKSFYKQMMLAMSSLFIWNSDPEKSTSFVYRQARKSSVFMSEEEAAARKLRNQAGTLLVVIGITILVSYTPILSVATLAAFHYNVPVTYSEAQAFILLMLSNASINPLIYFLLNKEFRLSAKSIFADSTLVMRLRRQSSTLNSVRGSMLASQTMTTEGGTSSRPVSLSTSHDHVVSLSSSRDHDVVRPCREEDTGEQQKETSETFVH